MATTMQDMSMLVLKLLDWQDQVAAVENQLKEKQEKVRILEEETIPAAMQELGLDSYKLNTGEEVSIKNDLSVNIPLKRRDEAYKWLEDNGFGGLIKTNVVTEFSKGEIEQAAGLVARLQEEGCRAKLKRDVHWQTLKAFVNEQLSTGKNIPEDLFGVFTLFTTKVKK